MKRELKFQGYKNCLTASQIGNIIKFLENKGIDADCVKGTKKEFIKNWEILKTQ